MYKTFIETDQTATEFLLWKEQWKFPLQRKFVISAMLGLLLLALLTGYLGYLTESEHFVAHFGYITGDHCAARTCVL